MFASFVIFLSITTVYLPVTLYDKLSWTRKIWSLRKAFFFFFRGCVKFRARGFTAKLARSNLRRGWILQLTSHLFRRRRRWRIKKRRAILRLDFFHFCSHVGRGSVHAQWLESFFSPFFYASAAMVECHCSSRYPKNGRVIK